MNKETVYWKWKNTIIDFDAISNETIDYNKYITKKYYIFHYLGTPDKQIHEWYNGGFSSEYNSALRYAKQLGLVVNYVDYDNEIYELKQQCQEQKEVIDKAMEYINKNLIVVSILDGVETFGLNSYTFDYKKLLDILKGGGINE